MIVTMRDVHTTYTLYVDENDFVTAACPNGAIQGFVGRAFADLLDVLFGGASTPPLPTEKNSLTKSSRTRSKDGA